MLHPYLGSFRPHRRSRYIFVVVCGVDHLTSHENTSHETECAESEHGVLKRRSHTIPCVVEIHDEPITANGEKTEE